MDAAPDQRLRRAQGQRAQEALTTTLARAEHVWVRQDYYTGTRWRHGLLLGWIKWRHGNEPARLMGRVMVIDMVWNQWKDDWETSGWDQLVEPDKIRLARTIKIGPEPRP